MNSVQYGLRTTGAGYFDTLMLDADAIKHLDSEGLKSLEDLKPAGLCKRIGVVGDGDAVDQCLRERKFDVLSTSYDVTANGQGRRRCREAADKEIVVLVRNPIPTQLIKDSEIPLTRKATSLFGVKPRDSLEGVGTFQFLRTTRDWTPQDICLAFLLTEPTMASVMLETTKPNDFAHLDALSDRDLPSGVPAQIEIARFADDNRPRRRA